MIHKEFLCSILPQKIRTKLERIYNYLVEPLYCTYYDKLPLCKLTGLNTNPRKEKIIVSLTSYPARFATLHICIKSLLNQTVPPDQVILYLDESTSLPQLPKPLLELYEQKLLSIECRSGSLKPHMKYFYAIQEHPSAVVVTVDDDTIHRRNLLHKLISSYRRYPNAVSAMRVHKMKTSSTQMIALYNDWYFEYIKETTPSFALFATGFGGALYPPNSLDAEAFHMEHIKALSYNADDVWLKFMQLKAGTPVVYVPSLHRIPVEIRAHMYTGLNLANVHQNQNDVYIRQLSEFYHINLADYC